MCTPEFARPLHEFAQRRRRGPSPLTEQERELIAAYVSAFNSCGSCQASHTEVCGHYGTPSLLADQLLVDVDTAPITPRLKPVFRYVRTLIVTPAHVTLADGEALYEAGGDETAVTHAALICTYFCFMNRWVEGLGIEADPAAVKRAGAILYRKGYAVVTEVLDQIPANSPQPIAVRLLIA